MGVFGQSVASHAETAEEAEEKYFDLWTAGQIEAFDYEMEYATTEVNEGEGDER